MALRFENKVAIVTGASSGLGATLAERLVAEGASVVGVGRNSERLHALCDTLASTGDNITAVLADLADPGQCASAVAAAIDHYGKLDILINAAGAHILRHSTEVTPEQWQRDIATNLNGPFFMSRYALPHLLASAGNIVNIGSLASQQGQAYSAAYCAAKHGIVGITRAMALEYTSQAIRINAVCPGGMLTPQVENFSAPADADFDLVMRSAAPRGMMTTDQVADTVLFVASDQASSLHGAVIMADNGKTAG